MKIKRMLLLLLSCFALAANAQTATTQQPTVYNFSVKDCIEYAKKNNVQVKNALLQISIQEQTNRSITAAAYPQINSSIGTQHNPNIAVQVIPDFISPATYGVLVNEGVRNGNGQPITMPNQFGALAAQFGTKWNANGTVSLNQILFNGEVFVGLQARSTAMQFYQKNYEVTEQIIQANVVKLYYQLVASKEQIAILDANITRAKVLLNDTKALWKNGFTEKLNVDRAEVQLANIETQKLQVKNQIDNGYLGLKYLIGMPVNDALVLTEQVTADKIKDGILDSFNHQYTARPEYEYAQLGVKLNELNLKRYKYAYYPTANLAAAYSKQAQRNAFNFFGKGDWFTASFIQFGVSMPIFNGFGRDANIKKTALELKQSQNQLSNLKNNIDNEVTTAKNNFKNAIITYDLQNKTVLLAEQVYNQTKKKFESGLASSTDIANTQADLITAQNNLINAMYNAIIARVDYFRASGKIPY